MTKLCMPYVSKTFCLCAVYWRLLRRQLCVLDNSSCIIFNPSLAKHDMPCLSKQCRSRPVASEEANWSGSALFVIKYANFYRNPGSSNLTGWKLEVSVSCLFSMTRVKLELFFRQSTHLHYMSRNVRQRTLWKVRPEKILISSYIRHVIRIFARCILDNQGCKVSSCGQRRLWSDCAHAQSDLSLRLADMAMVSFLTQRLM